MFGSGFVFWFLIVCLLLWLLCFWLGGFAGVFFSWFRCYGVMVPRVGWVVAVDLTAVWFVALVILLFCRFCWVLLVVKLLFVWVLR